ncbi:MAG: EamA family transporter [Anaerolineae bacterium]|nr:EamA family transporter [Anaerolineae bacterium]
MFSHLFSSSHLSPHTRAVMQALFVTFLWSTSWVLIKLGLDAIPALTFAGLRYTLAWVVLVGVYAARYSPSPSDGEGVRGWGWRDWLRLALLGLIFYTVTQGSQFLALDRLPAVTLSLLLSLSPVMVALLGMLLLDERLTRAQWAGIALYLVGAIIYFYPAAIPTDQIVGLIIALIGVLANALAAILGRDINRRESLPPLLVTLASMGVGAPILLIAGLIVQPAPALDGQGLVIIGWLAVVNTAFAFTLWNHTQRTLSAIESSIINNTMTIQIAVLAWAFLGEALTAREIGGLALAGVGTLIVQVKRGRAA